MIKKLFIVMMMIMSISYTHAEIIKEGKTYSQVTNTKSKTPGKDSGFTYKDNKGNIYPIMISKSGSCYILRVSKKSGKTYKQYLGKEISQEICKELGVEYKNKK